MTETEMLIEIHRTVMEILPRTVSTELNLKALSDHVQTQNGRVGKLEVAVRDQQNYCREVQKTKELQDARVAGRRDVRDSEKRIIQNILDNVSHPMVYLVFGLVLGFAAAASAGWERFAPW